MSERINSERPNEFVGMRIPPLKQLGLLDSEAKVTDLANKWRQDETYSDACKGILDSVYPTGQKDVEPGPDVDKSKAATWLASHLKVGDGAAKQMAALYAIVASGDAALEAGDPSGANQTNSSPKPKKNKTSSPTKSQSANTSGRVNGSNEPVVPEPIHRPQTLSSKRLQPTVHLDVQIHISPDASNDQIEKIFESMGKHLFTRTDNE